jgi:anaerobic selenocysteine-containing dehydrogenase
VLVRGADPSYGLSGSADFSGALRNASTVVSFSNFLDETTKQADWILPEHHMLEDWGDDIPEPGPGYAALGVQQPVVKPVLNTRGFGDVLISISRKLNLNMPWSTVEEMVKDQVKRNFDRGSTGMIRASNSDDFWRGVLMRGGWWDVKEISTDSTNIQSTFPIQGVEPEFTQGEYHLIPFPHVALTDGSGANLVWLQATPDPLTTVAWKTWVEINPRTAEDLSIREGDIVELSAGPRTIEVPVYVHPAAAPDVVSVPIGQGHTDYGQWAAGRGENVLSLLGDKSDAETGALAWASTKVNIIKTGKRIVMPKMEGSVPAIETVDTDIIQVTNGTYSH